MNEALYAMTEGAFRAGFDLSLEFACGFVAGWPPTDQDLLFTTTLFGPFTNPLVECNSSSDL